MACVVQESNQLKDFPIAVLGIKTLQTLKLASNMLTDLNDGLQLLPHLNHLTIYNNNFTHKPWPPVVLKTMRSHARIAVAVANSPIDPGLEMRSLPGQSCSLDPALSGTRELSCGLRCDAVPGLTNETHVPFDDVVRRIGTDLALEQWCTTQQRGSWDCGYGIVEFPFEGQERCMHGGQLCETTLVAPPGKRIRVYVDERACRQYFYDGPDRSARLMLQKTEKTMHIRGRVLTSTSNKMHFVYHALPIGFGAFGFRYQAV